ncbi:MAG: ABC transporter ATP-binding protein [Bacteroidota bacterium]
MTRAERRSDIHFLLAESNTAQAIKRSMDFVRDYADHPDLLRDILRLSRRWQTIDQQETTTTSRHAKAEIVARVTEIVDLIGASVADEPVPTQPTPVAVQLQGVRKTFGKTGFTLGPVDTDFRVGEIAGLVGPNANGKTTLLRIIAGELHHETGNLQYPHLPLPTTKKRWRYLSTQLAYVPQRLPAWGGTLRQHLHFAASSHGLHGAANELAVDYIVHRLGLDDYLNRKWSELSGGYQLRFALAQALVWHPTILLIDEPLANLDVRAQLLLLNDLQDLARSARHPISILVSSQHLHEIEAVADQLLVLDNGTVTYSGRQADFATDRTTNVFEFACQLSHPELLQRLGRLDYQKLHHNGFYFVLRTDRELAADQFLAYCQTQQIQLDYFRNISTSVKQYFV